MALAKPYPFMPVQTVKQVQFAILSPEEIVRCFVTSFSFSCLCSPYGPSYNAALFSSPSAYLAIPPIRFSTRHPREA